MLRINRNSGRVGVDGKYRTWQEIEEKYAETYDGKITKKLDEFIIKSEGACAEFLCMCRANVHKWLLAKPEELDKAKRDVDNALEKLTEEERATVLKELKNAYNYTNNRPVELAKWLSVKTCPYCNMQYTLYVNDEREGEKALLEFDHFLPQSRYPMFSMSLYNLIPSCRTCNNGKGKGDWSLEYHPYHAAIRDKLSFRVKNLLPLLVAREEEIEIETEHPHDDEWKKYEAATHVETLYQRHSDVAREVFGRAYAYRYYKEYQIPGLRGDKVFAERLLKGFYPDTEEIEKRPLTKFEQDIWKQAEQLYNDIIPERER